MYKYKHDKQTVMIEEGLVNCLVPLSSAVFSPK